MDTTDHASECNASDLAKLIGIPCARFEIGVFHGREGSISYNIVERNSMALIEGIYCISLFYNDFDVEKLIDIKTGEKYSLEMIEKVLKAFNLFDDFLPILVFDFLIGNTDRHQSNWALIMEDKKLRLSPLYDNSSSLCAYVRESKIDQYFGNDSLMWNSLVDTKSRSLIRLNSNDKKLPTHTDVLRVLHKKYYTQTADTVNKISTFVTSNQICDILDKYNEVLSNKRKCLIKKYLLSKIKIMQDIYHAKR